MFNFDSKSRKIKCVRVLFRVVFLYIDKQFAVLFAHLPMNSQCCHLQFNLPRINLNAFRLFRCCS